MIKSGGILRTLWQNPKATAIGLGLAAGAGYGIKRSRGRARDLEASMMANYMGAPSAKYVYAELEKFAERKHATSVKVAQHYDAARHGFGMGPYGHTRPSADPVKGWEYYQPSGIGDVAMGAATGAVAKTLTEKGIEAIGALIRGTARNVKERLVLNKERETMVDSLIKHDPIISVMERANPGSTYKAYGSMVRFAPTLSLDPNVVTSFLREATQSEGGIQPLAVQQLAQTERAINESKMYR